MSWRGAVLAGVSAAAGVGLVVAAPAVRLAFDEGAVPPASAAPALPDGVTVQHEDVLCGSGGCWRQLTLLGADGESASELAARLGSAEETCRTRSLLDRRRVCSGVTVVGDEVRLSVRFDRPL